MDLTSTTGVTCNATAPLVRTSYAPSAMEHGVFLFQSRQQGSWAVAKRSATLRGRPVWAKWGV